MVEEELAKLIVNYAMDQVNTSQVTAQGAKDQVLFLCQIQARHVIDVMVVVDSLRKFATYAEDVDMHSDNSQIHVTLQLSNKHVANVEGTEENLQVTVLDAAVEESLWLSVQQDNVKDVGVMEHSLQAIVLVVEDADGQ